MTNLKATCSSNLVERCHLVGIYEVSSIRIYTFLRQIRLDDSVLLS